MKLGLITDIHEQSGSLERALVSAAKMGCDELVCLGDIIGFDADLYSGNGKRSAAECVRLVKENCRSVVCGNHDLEIPDTGNDLTEPDLEYLHSLPEFIKVRAGEAEILLSHYLYPDFTGSSMVFVRRSNQLHDLFGYLQQQNISLAFAGHDHPSGVGFGYPGKPGWRSQYLRAFHYMPFSRYEMDGQMVVCLLPALANRLGRPGFSVWDSDSNTLDILQLTL